MNRHNKIYGLLNLSAAGVLDENEQNQVQDHMVQCPSCHAEFSGWVHLTDALKKLPTPQAPAALILKMHRLLELRMASQRESRWNWAILSFLVLFSWMVAVLNWFFVRLFDMPLAHWLDVSSTTIRVTYIGMTWLATALAAGLLGRHLQQKEGHL
jgi:anti-sigma factor RsiW